MDDAFAHASLSHKSRRKRPRRPGAAEKEASDLKSASRPGGNGCGQSMVLAREPVAPNDAEPESLDLASLERALENVRGRALEAFALAQALADALCALPAGAVDERLQALAQILERAAHETFTAADSRPPRARPEGQGEPAAEQVIPILF